MNRIVVNSYIQSENFHEFIQLITSQKELVYFIQAGNGGAIKIGSSKNIGGRLSALQTSHYETLKIIGICEGGVDTEKRLHQKFKVYRINGEWFAPNEEIYRYIDKNSIFSIDGMTHNECEIPHVSDEITTDNDYSSHSIQYGCMKHSDYKEDPINSEWVLNYCTVKKERESESYEDYTRPLNDSYSNGRYSGYLSALRDILYEIKVYKELTERQKEKDNEV